MFSVASCFRSQFSQSRFSTAKALLAAVLLLAVVAMLAAPPAVGQDKFALQIGPDTSDAPKISGQVSGGVIGGVPVGDLRNNVGTMGGVRLSLAGWMDRSPVMLGLDLRFFGYGHVDEEVPLSSTVSPRVPGKVSISNKVVATHLTARLQPRTGRFRPYAEALAGFKYLLTRARIDEDDVDGDFRDEVASAAKFNDFAFSGGVGAGIDIQVYRQENPAKKVRRVDLQFGVQYLLRQEVESLTEGALNDPNGTSRIDRSELDIRRSRTTLLQPTFGVTVRLAD